ncbi:MAG: DUF58 domain-containing protein [Lentisphaeria bacterium]|nr:DUF58 domain-containing protein [Lentisphaeria bacterium]
MLQFLRRCRKRFYDGPRFLGLEPPRRDGYRSPTVVFGIWCYALVVKHLTMAGLIMVLCTSLVSLYAMFSLMMPTHLLAFSLASLLALNVVVGFFACPRVTAHRDLPERIGAGGEHAVTYTLVNRSRFSCHDLCVDSLPLPRGLRYASGRAFCRVLGGRETLRMEAVIQADRRGRYLLPVLRVDSAFPLDLWRWGTRGEGSRVLTVCPAFTPILQFDFSTGMRYQAGGIALSSKVGESMEFLGCREFRTGDDLRRLHWRSWARTGSPVVKEFREEYLCRTALILDTHRPHPYFWERPFRPLDKPFEAAISLAAAVADHLALQDYIIDLFAAGPEVYRFRGGRSLGFLENILDILACVQPHHEEPFAEFHEELVQEIARISSAVFLLLTWNDVRRDLIEEMRAAGVTVRAFFVAETGRPLPEDLPAHVTVLHTQDVLDGRCTRL